MRANKSWFLYILVLMLPLLVLSAYQLWGSSDTDAVAGHSVKELSNYGGFDELRRGNGGRQNLTVAIIDTGIFPHKDLTGNLILFKDFVGGRTESYDDNGHGTEVSGIIAGRGTVSDGNYEGVAPDTKLIMLKAFNQEGMTDVLTFSQAVEWIIDNRMKYHIRLVSMSVGFRPSPDFDNIILKELMDRLIENDILLVTSAGNDGANGQITLPGIYDNVLTVGSLAYDPLVNKNVTKSGISVFSSRVSPNKNKPDLYAPGESVVTTSANGKYKTVQGTSYSAAMVTGQIALVMQEHPDMSASEIRSLVNERTKGAIFSYKK